MDKQTDRQIDRQTGRYTDRQMNTDSEMHEFTWLRQFQYRGMDRWIDRQTDR